MSSFNLLLLDVLSTLQCQIAANLSFLFPHLQFEQCLDLVFYFVSLVLCVLQKAEKYGIMKQSDLHRVPSFIKEHCITGFYYIQNCIIPENHNLDGEGMCFHWDSF